MRREAVVAFLPSEPSPEPPQSLDHDSISIRERHTGQVTLLLGARPTGSCSRLGAPHPTGPSRRAYRTGSGSLPSALLSGGRLRDQAGVGLGRLSVACSPGGPSLSLLPALRDRLPAPSPGASGHPPSRLSPRSRRTVWKAPAPRSRWTARMVSAIASSGPMNRRSHSSPSSSLIISSLDVRRWACYQTLERCRPRADGR